MIQDAGMDRRHSKKMRAIASGKISKNHARVLLFCLIVIISVLSYLNGHVIGSFGLPTLYLLLNISSSNGLKNLPLVEVVIITADFVIRLLCGGELTDVNISNVLLLPVILASMFLSFGKRLMNYAREPVCEKIACSF